MDVPDARDLQARQLAAQLRAAHRFRVVGQRVPELLKAAAPGAQERLRLGQTGRRAGQLASKPGGHGSHILVINYGSIVALPAAPRCDPDHRLARTRSGTPAVRQKILGFQSDG